MRAHPLHGSPVLDDAYARCRSRRRLRLELARLRSSSDRGASGGSGGSGASGGTDDAHTAGMRRALIALEYVTAEDVLLLKGRAACCIEAANELLATEVRVTTPLLPR